MDEVAGRLRPVDFDFWWPQRPELGWQVIGLRGREEISRPYEFEIELLCSDGMFDPEELLGADCELLLDRNGLARTVFGVVAEVEMIVAPTLAHDGVGVRVALVPAFRLLEHEIDTRFYMGQTVIEILRDRLGSALAGFGRELDVESRISGRYNRRDYCVQFRESTFDFCGRIMEEEGIAYLFVPDHDGQRETMVLVDDNAAYASADLLVPGPVPIVPTAAEEIDRESIQAFEWRRRRTPNRVITRGYNYKQPTRYDEGEAERLAGGRASEQYLHDDRRQIIDDPVDDPEAKQFDGAALDQRSSLASRILQRRSVEAARGHGRSNAVGFAAGRAFELGEPLDATGGAQAFLITRVEHHGTIDGDPASTMIAYQNRFECIPSSTPFRPPRRTPRPRVHGVQTGIVVGRTADEVYTDPLGRIKVKFHHDRSEVAGEHASCWIRVAQVWAGNGYGAMIIPRVGMEVVVAFVDGNPDCPLVTGTVYHGGNAPPYPLPAELSKSTIKTRSTPGGDGFHELRLEDEDGREQVFVHAQRRMDVRVRGTLLETASAGREEVIGSKDSDSNNPDHGSHNTRVHGTVNHRVEKHRRAEVGWQDSRAVGDDSVEDLQANNYVFVADLSQLNAANIVTEATDRTSHKASKIVLAGSSAVTVKGGDSVVIQSNNRVELVVGQSFIALTPTSVEIGGDSILLNSGGGAVGRAEDGVLTVGAHLFDPIDAYVADDGRLRSGASGGGGGGGRRAPRPRWLEPRHAPPMQPMKPKKPSKEQAADADRQILSVAWAVHEAWCSEPTPLVVNSAGYDGSIDETLMIDNQADGVTQCVDVVLPSAPSCGITVAITDVVPRRIGDGLEPHRQLLASLQHAQTPIPLLFRFLSEVPPVRYTPGRSRFDVSVDDHVVVVGGEIQFTRGWIFYIIRLDDHVAEGTGGLIGGKYYGSRDYRYCKKTTDADGKVRYVFWDGAFWRDVPSAWSNPMGTKLYGMAVWREGSVVKTQYGKLPWPDEVPQPWNDVEGDEWVVEHLKYWAAIVEESWSNKMEIVRNECRSHEVWCCRYRVRCKVWFNESEIKHRDGIILAQNHARANASAWPSDIGWDVVAHEYGHHMGNPDEYPGATSVDPTVNDDGAKAGIDRDSIMGSGELVRRRHFNSVCEALALAVASHTGKKFTYKPVYPA